MDLLLLLCTSTCNLTVFDAPLCPCFSRALLDTPKAGILILLLKQSRHIRGYEYLLQYYGSSLFQHPERHPEINSIFCRYYPLRIFRLCYYYLLSSHPSDCNITTQYSHHKTVYSEHKTCCLVPWNNTCTLPPTIDEAPPHQIFSGHPLIQHFYWNIQICKHCNHNRLTSF